MGIIGKASMYVPMTEETRKTVGDGGGSAVVPSFYSVVILFHVTV